MKRPAHLTLVDADKIGAVFAQRTEWRERAEKAEARNEVLEKLKGLSIPKGKWSICAAHNRAYWTDEGCFPCRIEALEKVEEQRDEWRRQHADLARALMARDARIEALEKMWWNRMSRGDIAAELSATFDLGLPVCTQIADWILSPIALAAEVKP